MTTAQADIMIEELRSIKTLLHQNRMDWVDTKGALFILRRKNPRVLKYVREHFMDNAGWRAEGRNFEYKTSALYTIRTRADMEQINIPK